MKLAPKVIDAFLSFLGGRGLRYKKLFFFFITKKIVNKKVNMV